MIEKKEVESISGFINRSDSMYKSKIQLTWLGQAGFSLKYENTLILIDPYLSDYLSKKYKGRLFPHIRLMRPPIRPDEILNINYVLCSHPHSDHMDPETITPISRNNPDCKFIVPAPEIAEAINRGIRKDQIILAYAHQIMELKSDIRIIPVPAKHEVFKTNNSNEHSFLGYIFNFGGKKVYHSGDSIPYDGLIQNLIDNEVEIALMPINGRDKYRLNNGIAGNFKIDEVLNICREANIKILFVHHFGMFAYNTATKEVLEYLKNIHDPNLEIIIPKMNYIYTINK